MPHEIGFYERHPEELSKIAAKNGKVLKITKKDEPKTTRKKLKEQSKKSEEATAVVVMPEKINQNLSDEQSRLIARL